MLKSEEMMRQELEAAGLPKTIAVESTIADANLKNKYLTASKLMISGVPVVQVFGLTSPEKELICAKLMRRYMFFKEKTGRWLTPARISPAPGDYPKSAGVVCLYGIDKLSIPKATNVAEILREWIPEGRAFIIAVSDETMLLSMFGRDLVSYLSHISVVLHVNAAPATPLTVETGEGLI